MQQPNTFNSVETQPSSPFATFNSKVMAVAFTTNGRRVAVGLVNGTIELWDLLTKEKWTTFSGHSDVVLSVALSGDGKTMVSGSNDKTVHLWDVETGQQKATFIGHRSGVKSVALSDDGKTVVSGSNDRTVRLWDVDSGQEKAAFNGHSAEVMSVALSGDGKTIVSSSRDKTVRLWDVDSGQEKATFIDHRSEIMSVALSSDGKTVVSGSRDGTVRLWNVKTAQQKAAFSGHSDEVWSVALSGDGKTIISGSWDGTVRLWDVETAQQKAVFSGHRAAVMSVALSGDGKTIATGSRDSTVRLWDVETAQEKTAFSGYREAVWSVALSGDGKTIATGSRDNTVRLWDVDTGREKATFSGHRDAVLSAGLSGDGKTLVSGSRDSTVRLWDIDTGQPKATFRGHSEAVSSVALSGDGKTLVSGSRDNTVRLWDVDTGQPKATLRGHSDEVSSVALSGDGKTVVSGSRDNTVRLWDVETGQPQAVFSGHSAVVSSVALSGDGKTAVSGSSDGTVRLWDVDIGQEKANLSGHSAEVSSVALSGDGKTVASGSYDKTVRLWDLTDPQHKRSLEIGKHSGTVYSVAFDPNGDYIFSGVADGIRVWRWRPFEVQRIPQAFQNDQPGDDDQLAIEKELRALADVLMMRSLEPPLAVAILGGWGSGKSFGMNLIKKHITSIRCRALTAPQTWAESPDDPKLSPYVGHIYQIKFDAWTYAKSDLWASLMQTIFFELNRQLTLEKQLAKIGSMQQRQALEDKLEQLRDSSLLIEPPQDSAQGLEELFPQPLVAAENKQFEKILASGELKPGAEISTEQQHDPELGKFWQFLQRTEQSEREALIALAEQIKPAESNFLLEEQDQEFWQVLNTLNDAERTTLVDKLVNSKLDSDEIKQKWKETSGKGNSLWEILGELKKEEQETLKATQLELESLKQKKAQIEKQLQLETEKIKQKRDRENETLALIKVFVNRLHQELQDKPENSIYRDLSSELGLEVPKNLAELDRELSNNNADLEQLIEKHAEQIEPLIENANKVKSLLEDNPRRKLIGLIEFTQKYKKTLLIFCVWLAVPLLVYAVFSLLPVVFPDLQLYEWAAQIFSSFKVGLVALVSIPGLNEALKILKKVTLWQAKINREFQAFQENVEAERQQLATAQPEKDKAQIAALQKLQEQIDATQSEITKLEIRAEAQRRQAGLTVQYGSLLEFVSDRLEQDSYQKRLGLMHQIKRDLEDLSDRLTCDLRHANPARLEALKTHFPRGSARVVLYIDDLDRCPPDRVVEVLEAIQLLLTTKLFIVIIAVDDRYINRALERTYQGILKRRGNPSGVDYLEKIIQIPYRMRAISEKTVLERYLRSQLGFTEEIKEETKPETQSAPEERQTRAIEPQRPSLTETEAVETRAPEQDDGSDRLNTPVVPAQSPEPSQPAISNKGDFIEVAKFTPEEFKIILDCCQYVDLTPRTTKRIINLCKILKLVWTPAPNDTRWQVEPALDVKQTVIAFLALSGRYPNQIRCVLEELYNNFEDEQLEASYRTHPLDSPELFKLERAKGELLRDAQKRYPLRDSYMEREWHRFEKDVMQVPPRGNATDNLNDNPENDRFILEQRTFNLLLSFCFIGDVGYDPDDIYPTPPVTLTNGKAPSASTDTIQSLAVTPDKQPDDGLASPDLDQRLAD